MRRAVPGEPQPGIADSYSDAETNTPTTKHHVSIYTLKQTSTYLTHTVLFQRRNNNRHVIQAGCDLFQAGGGANVVVPEGEGAAGSEQEAAVQAML